LSGSTLLQSTLDALASWPVYALTAVGFVVIYRATRVFNFATGALLLLGAYATYDFTVRLALPTPVALVLVFIALGLLGAVLYLVALRPMTGQPTFALIIVTRGLSIIATGLAGVVWGYSPLHVPAPKLGPALSLGSARLAMFDVVSVFVAAIIIVALGLFFRYTPIGLQMRATAESPTLASRRGVSVQVVYTAAWMLAAIVSAGAGVILAYRAGAAPALADIGLRAFPAALIGGFDSLAGAVIGALIISLASTYAANIWSSEVEDLVVFGLMLVVLIVRPYGLLGTREVLRV
jgi:branched-chain amino acid transport system permease protein